MIYVNNVSLTLNRHRILDQISIHVDSGEAVGIIGGNGSGKTMLMTCILGFITTFEGQIMVSGVKICSDAEFPPDTGFIIETPGFIPYVSGYDNLRILADINKKIRKSQIQDTMQLVGLDPSDRRPVRKYSLGMRQRLGIAQALMENPSVLILDEPFNGLDKKKSAEVRDILVDKKNNGTTILMTSHNEKDIEYICDRTYEIDEGKIIK